MPKFKVIFTIEVNTEAVDHQEAEMIALDCADWGNANIEVLEEESKDD
jgi:hypothetical protein|tara:strand:+ start:174 stop:317 length:144 start_codon:yes stop_codon:yes gene_type:complete